MSKRTAIAIAGLLALTACGTEPGPAVTAPAAGTNRPAETVEPIETEAPEPTEEPELLDEVDAPGATLFTFGQTKTWRWAETEDAVNESSDPALSLTVGEPESYDPGENKEYMSQDWPDYVRMQVTVINPGDEPYDPTFFFTSMQSGNVEAEEEVFLGDAPQTMILPGREATWQIGYGVQNPDDIVLQVQPSFELSSVIFTN